MSDTHFIFGARTAVQVPQGLDATLLRELWSCFCCRAGELELCAGEEGKIVIGDVVLDYDSQTVRRGDEIQELPQKEFLLLYKLLSYPGKIFTRIQLMDEIWGSESETGWETVTVHIGRLRKRFENFMEFKIESVRGLGYKAVKTI